MSFQIIVTDEKKTGSRLVFWHFQSHHRAMKSSPAQSGVTVDWLLFSGSCRFNSLQQFCGGEHARSVAVIGLVSCRQHLTTVVHADDVLHCVLEIVHARSERFPEALLVNIRQLEGIQNIGDEAAAFSWPAYLLMM